MNSYLYDFKSYNYKNKVILLVTEICNIMKIKSQIYKDKVIILRE